MIRARWSHIAKSGAARHCFDDGTAADQLSRSEELADDAANCERVSSRDLTIGKGSIDL